MAGWILLRKMDGNADDADLGGFCTDFFIAALQR
jgi:hypothetical protein